MKHYIISILTLLLFVSQAGAQQFNQDTTSTPPQPQGQQGWVQENSGTTESLLDLSYPTKDTAFAFGGGALLQTTDGGTTWLPFQAPTKSFISFIDSRNGYIVSYSGGAVYHTSNAGLTWTSGNDNAEGITTLVNAVTVDTAFVAGGASISRTTNAGKTWTPSYPNVNNINAMAFADSKHGIVVGNLQPGPFPHNELTSGCFTTTDGGQTWVQQYLGAGDALYGVTCLNIDTIIAVGGVGYVSRSTNGGLTWDSLPIGSSNGFIAITCRGNRIIAVGGGSAGTGLIMTSTNAGLSWNQEQSGTTQVLTAVTMFNDSTAFVAGYNGVILKTTNGGTDWIQLSPPSSQYLVVTTFPEPSTGQLQFSYSLPKLQSVSLTVFDIQGHLVASVLNKQLETVGSHNIGFDGTLLPVGIYTYQFQTELYNTTGKFAIVK